MSSFSVTMLMTEQCNLRCTYCYEAFEYKGIDEKSLEKVRLLFIRLSQSYSELNVAFFGGEPLISYDAIKYIITENQSLPSSFSYALTSNGTLLDQSRLQYLADNGLKQAQITLDGLGKSHDSARKYVSGKGTFDLIYSNLLSYRDVGGDTDLIIRINASPQNQQDILVLARRIVDDFGHDRRFKAFIRPVGKWGGDNDDAIQTLTASTYKALERAFYDIVPPAMTWALPENDICYAAMPNHILIYPDGRLGKCTVGLHDALNDIGHVEADGGLNIDSEKLSYWSRGLVSGKQSDLSCPYWSK